MGQTIQKKILLGFILVLAFSLAAASSPAGQPAAEKQIALEVLATPFFLEEGGVTKQVLRVSIDNGGDPVNGKLAAKLGTSEHTLDLALIPKGKSEYTLAVQEIKAPVKASFLLTAGPNVFKLERELRPQRKWTVYLFHHSHTDIGYTDLQTRIFKKHAEYLDDVIRYCRETEGYPDEAKFRWNAEVAWTVENYIKRRPEEKVEELMDLIRKGRVEVGAWYLQLSDCFGHEELIRALYPARELGRKYGIPVTCAMNNDVTGWSWASPQVLSRSGVRYFATGINETRSLAALRRPCAFYWESPDGSRILHWNGEHYLFANYELRIHEGEEKSRPAVEKYLTALEGRGDYPFDLIAFNVSAWTTDNCPPGRALSDLVRDWNTHWVYPKLRLATMREFFAALEGNYETRIPTYKLGWPDYWTDGVASTAYETGVNRTAHNELLSAEKLAAIAASVGPGFVYPGAEIDEGYRATMFYDEHTWGAHNSIDEPAAEFVRGQWALKSSFAYKASEIGRTLSRTGLESLVRQIQIQDSPSFMVFNPLSWTRTDIVKVTLPQPLVEKKGDFRLIDRRTGLEVPFQLADERTVLFLARDVPSMGYAVYSVSFGQGQTPAVPAASFTGNSLENRFYRVAVDPDTGGLKSVFDLASKRELVDVSAPYSLNQYIYENPEGGRIAVDDMTKRAVFKRRSPANAQIKPGLKGPIAWSLEVRSDAPGCRELESEVILYNGLKRLDIVNRLQKEDIFLPEAVYFAFPFKKEGGKFVFEIADGMMRPEVDQLPRTVRDWHTVQNWVELSGTDHTVVWSAVEAPLVQFGDINTGKWLKKLEVLNPWLFSYAMNNYWMTNFKASQGGPAVFCYSLPSPLLASWIPEDSKGTLDAGGRSFFQVDRANVIIQAVKMAEDGEGLIIRLREIAGVSSNILLGSPFFQTRAPSAWLTDMAEKNEAPAQVSETGITVPMKAFGIQAVRVARAR
jgi:Glycosyl hydrolases family 38 N-terminal domain/Glycosyl hydrolases family 38 C-terminal domain/Glycosyl hydrolases family 38 C-terminal beta sandwich domain